jgi:hypothetical protein
VKSTVESCDKIKVAVSQIFDRVKPVALRAIRTKRGNLLHVNGGQGGGMFFFYKKNILIPNVAEKIF